MQINQFPHQYETQRKSKAENDAYAERNRSSSRQKSIRDGISGSVETGAWACYNWIRCWFFCLLQYVH